MNFKASIKYQIKDNIRSIIVFYFIILFVMSLITISVVMPNNSGSSSLSGMEMSSVIFLFILGLSSFKDNFHMFLQNGLSRKTLFLSEVLSMLVIAVGMSIVDFSILKLIKLISENVRGLKATSIFEMSYYKHIDSISNLQMYTEKLIFQIGMYLAISLVGYFIAIAYYRMNKAAKRAVAIGVPVGFSCILPLIDATLTNGKITKFINDVITYAFGIKSGNPYHAMITFLIVAITFGCFSWLVMRKAVVKNS